MYGIFTNKKVFDIYIFRSRAFIVKRRPETPPKQHPSVGGHIETKAWVILVTRFTVGNLHADPCIHILVRDTTIRIEKCQVVKRIGQE